MEEIWKDYKGYKISNLGRLENSRGIVNGSPNKDGYLKVTINYKTRTIHQLVAECFLNHIPCGHKIVVDHIDNNKLNNRVDNLQLISARLNTSKDKGTEFTGVQKNGNKFKSLIRFNGKNVFLGTFNTSEEASKSYQKALQSIKNDKEIVVKERIYTSEYEGVYYNKKSKKWMARYKGKYLGLFNTGKEAYEKVNNEND